MPDSKIIFALSLVSLFILSACGGSGTQSSPLDPNSYTVTEYAGKQIVATSGSGAFAFLDSSNNVHFVSNDGISTQIIANLQDFTYGHLSPDGRRLLVVTTQQIAPFDLESKYFVDGVQQTIPATPAGSTSPLMVDDNGFLYGQKPGEIYRTNVATTEFCTTPNNGLQSISLAFINSGENPIYLRSYMLGVGAPNPDGKWYEFKANAAPTLIHDLNGSNSSFYEVPGVSNDGTAFGRDGHTTPARSFSKPINGPITLGSSSSAFKVFGRLSDGSLFLSDGSEYFIESGQDRLNISEVTGLSPTESAAASFARGNSIFTYATNGSTERIVVVRRK